MNSQNSIKLSDYKSFAYEIPDIYLSFSIYKDHVDVVSLMKVKAKNDKKEKLILKGVEINLKEVLINNSKVQDDLFSYHDDELILRETPRDYFELEIHSEIYPYTNTSLEGLYSSCDILTTQCEAEGFRRICFHPDRPDVLSKFTVKIEADINQYPILLSNGNKVHSSITKKNSSRHQVIWKDPFPKPSYLFALVAGNIIEVKDYYISNTGKNISISLFVEAGDEVYTEHALGSLKRAMKWDEDVYGLEYDLDQYNIVAIRHFNMGAMENKSLNIFNSKLVLADSEITTDSELERIESVIAHEYFHNWTGNRITCRDWFQLSLKEGLTVFRDQSFTSKLHSPVLKRIEDVSLLRRTQFKEDSGPTSHPVKPSEYVSIDNFYTTTIYEKGAEIIRMLHTLLGEENYMAGIANYIRTFDGSAATTENFVYSLIEGAKNNGYKESFNVNQFILWYYQSGTPLITIKREWDQENSRLKLVIKQNSIDNKNDYKPLVIPIEVAIIRNNNSYNNQLLVLEKEEQVFNFTTKHNCLELPVFSLFRNFSSPVNWQTDYSLEELLYLIDNDDDLFSKWNYLQQLLREVIISRSEQRVNHEVEIALLKSYEKIVINYGEIDPGFVATILDIPSVSELESYQTKIDPNSLYDSVIYLSTLIGKSISDSLITLLAKCYNKADQDWPKGKGHRKLISMIWKLLSFQENLAIRQEILIAVTGPSMTLSMSALYALRPIDCLERHLAMERFYVKWKDNPIVLDNWFKLEASINRTDSLNIINKLLNHPRFDPIAPNSIRAVLGGYVQNTKSFHSLDGSGYKFMAEQIISVDKRNPITASRLSKVFSRWTSYATPNSKNMLKAIEFLNEHNLSSNTREVVELMLKQSK